jgi:hypothetical protein
MALLGFHIGLFSIDLFAIITRVVSGEYSPVSAKMAKADVVQIKRHRFRLHAGDVIAASFGCACWGRV